MGYSSRRRRQEEYNDVYLLGFAALSAIHPLQRHARHTETSVSYFLRQMFFFFSCTQTHLSRVYLTEKRKYSLSVCLAYNRKGC